MIRLLLTVLLSTISVSVLAVDKVEVQGLFSRKAVLSVDGKRYILAVGESSPEGVKVVSASSRGAVLEVDGEQQQYNIGSTSFSTSYAVPEENSETIYKNSAGMYMTFGNINGRPVQLLVDTGASAVSMNADQAKQLGIDFKKYGTEAGVSTASGFVKAYRVKLRSVSVGSISQKNVDAFVIDGKHPGPILLGMTFLGRLSIEHSGNAMELTQ
jgi:aspartyl protease family protein